MACRSRGWAFTLFHYTEEDINKIKKLEVQYQCVGKEICPKSKEPHLQGYLYYANPVRFETVKTSIRKEVHLESARYSAKRNARYCKKEGDWWEQGEPPMMGARSDLAEVALMVRNGASLEQVAEENPEVYVRYSRGLQALQTKVMKHRTERPNVTWIWGSTGVGKTRYAVELCDSFYMKDGTKWWDGYEQQKWIILDDFHWDGKVESFREFLRMIDRYKYQGETKGGHVKINSPQIVITCEHAPDKFWYDTKLDQVIRRLNKVIHLSGTEVVGTEVPGNTIPEPQNSVAAGAAPPPPQI
ncbi:replication-associated protein [Dragonfly larvae associated circular virus-6]|uniref:replication-associated protein n=1 Tax=Dragonfly larvae associated circular virus-6 TaxID=1454027 RepID=UPI0003E817FF|nr:replication-associated protein [Dragonfly larvae associated circular virus-6]AHH31475.1 replication-associated protein [Dragonfly larvae associated circular virus-6]